jgi:hypothetical protein
MEGLKMKIEEIKIITVPDECPDFSYLGEYNNWGNDWDICCHCGEYVHNHLEDCPRSTRSLNFFTPYAGGEPQGSETYKEYGKRDFERMEDYNNNGWSFIGIKAVATVSYSIGNGDRQLETLESGGLWGVESDSGEYLNEVAADELLYLKGHIAQFGVDVSEFDKMIPEYDLS